ncbi:MAG: cytochrome-c oxidase, cbb3-type subunit II [Deltaproteobacteria bacterium]|nr:cytochrome-c oxidase, cbb3-type subunit II [Candidatus Deferrimicrobiaceae bacterium]
MKLYENPVLLAVAAAVVISVGTLVTTFLPLFHPSTQPVSPLVKPYSAIELEGRDLYVQEGCNNCHTQTVRPLRTEVARYGDYSKPEEFAYDRPFLWGSRRTGPDLAREGGKYPDSWHYQHMADPQGMFDKSNMPSYAWLAKRRLDTSSSLRKVNVLGYGYDGAEVRRQIDGFRSTVTAASYPSSAARARVTPETLRGEITEMDAMVAYLQKLGHDLKVAAKKEPAGARTSAAEARNPYAGVKKAEEEGENLYKANCSSCHGEKAKGGFGPDLTDPQWKYGGTDGDLFASIAGGRPGGMPVFESALGKDRIWKVITYLRKLGSR